MAKSTNHTAHNQSYKNHRNGTLKGLTGARRRRGVPKSAVTRVTGLECSLAMKRRRQKGMPSCRGSALPPRIRGVLQRTGEGRQLCSCSVWRAVWISSSCVVVCCDVAMHPGRTSYFFMEDCQNSNPKKKLCVGGIDRCVPLCAPVTQLPSTSPHSHPRRRQEAQDEGDEEVAQGGECLHLSAPQKPPPSRVNQKQPFHFFFFGKKHAILFTKHKAAPAEHLFLPLLQRTDGP
jgi:hypothetical protein